SMYARLITLPRDVGNGGNTDPFKLRLPDDVSLHENPMILQILGAKVAAKVSEIRKPVFPQTKHGHLRPPNLIGRGTIRHACANGACGVTEHPRDRLIAKAADRKN